MSTGIALLNASVKTELIDDISWEKKAQTVHKVTEFIVREGSRSQVILMKPSFIILEPSGTSRSRLEAQHTHGQ